MLILRSRTGTLVPKFWVIFLQNLRVLSSIAIRLTKITGKSPVAVHPKHLTNFRPWFLKYLKKKDIVLDIGCANGQQTIKAAKFVKKIIGIDVDLAELKKGMMESARKKIKNVKFLKSSAEEKLKFSQNSFDKVLFFDVLEHLENQDLTLSEIWRVLKKGGLLLLSVPNKNTSWKKLQRSVGLSYFSDSDHKREYNQNEIKNLLEKHELKILNIAPIVFDTPIAPIFDLIGGFSISIYSKFAAWKRKKVQERPTESTGFEIVAQKM